MTDLKFKAGDHVMVPARVTGITDNPPTQEDAARRLRVSVKTIYNRLTRADLKLARIKEDAR